MQDLVRALLWDRGQGQVVAVGTPSTGCVWEGEAPSKASKELWCLQKGPVLPHGAAPASCPCCPTVSLLPITPRTAWHNILVPNQPPGQSRHVLAGRFVADGQHLPAGMSSVLRALMGHQFTKVTARTFYLPVFQTCLDRALGLPCPCCGSKEKNNLFLCCF